MRPDFEAVIAHLPRATLVVGQDGLVLGCNPAACEVFGAPLVGESWPEIAGQHRFGATITIPDDVRGRFAQIHGALYRMDLSWLPDGAQLCQLRPVLDDVRHEDMRWFRLIQRGLDSVDDAIEVTDARACIEYVNPAWEAMTGFSREQAVGKPPGDLLRSGKHTDAFYNNIFATVRRGERWRGVLISRHASGQLFENELTVTPVQTDTGQWAGFVAIRRDTFDMRRRADLERQLHRAEHLAAMGQLSAGVAHEINNPLTYVSANLSWVGQEVSQLDEVPRARRAELLEVIHEASDGASRIAHIVRDLRDYARVRDEVLGPVVVRTACLTALKMVRNQVAHRAIVEVDLGEGIALATEDRLVQVLVNLLTNAAEAIPLGQPTRNTVRLASRTEGERELIEVQDTGCGLADDAQERIFDSFFTSKGQVGTGLGLAVCRRLIERMGGHIEVESTEGVGSIFRLVLRSGESEPDQVTTRDFQRSVPGLRVLIVDDEVTVAESLKRLLRDHSVEVATSGRQALELLGSQSFDAVLCDVMMPEMTGLELLGHIRDRHPEMVPKVCFMTGGAFVKEIRTELETRELRCLPKPLSTRAIETWLQELTEQ